MEKKYFTHIMIAYGEGKVGMTASGRGKVGGKMHYRKILRDNLNDITKSSIRRLAFLAGITRVSKLVYEEARSVLKIKMEDYIRVAVTYMEHARRKTLSYDDLVHTVAYFGKKLYGTKDTVYPVCKNIDALKKKNNNCGVVIGKFPFSRLTREIIQDFKTDLRVSQGFQENFQFVIEQCMIELFAKAHDVSKVAKRETLHASDIHFIRSVCEKSRSQIRLSIKKKRKTKKAKKAKK
jgi:histone H4